MFARFSLTSEQKARKKNWKTSLDVAWLSVRKIPNKSPGIIIHAKKKKKKQKRKRQKINVLCTSWVAVRLKPVAAFNLFASGCVSLSLSASLCRFFSTGVSSFETTLTISTSRSTLISEPTTSQSLRFYGLQRIDTSTYLYRWPSQFPSPSL